MQPPSQIASEVTIIGRISVVMYVSDQFVDGKLQLTDYQDPSIKLGFRWGQDENNNKKRFKIAQKHQNLVASAVHFFVA